MTQTPPAAGPRTLVYVATTNGPSQVQRLTKVQIAAKSVIGLNHTSELAGVSKGYHRFVANASGVIARHTNHEHYRLDLSVNITDGRSWELGVFLAHVLSAESRLSVDAEEADCAIWATGTVNNLLAVGQVEGVVRKLETSAALFEELKARHVPVIFVLPKENDTPDVVEALNKARETMPSAEVHFIDSIDFSSAGLLPQGGRAASATTVNSAPVRRPRGAMRWPAISRPLLAGLVLGTIALGGAVTSRVWSPSNAPGAASTLSGHLEIVEPDTRGQCGTSGTTRTLSLSWPRRGSLRSSRDTVPCAVTVQLALPEDSDLEALVLVDRGTPNAPLFYPRPLPLSSDGQGQNLFEIPKGAAQSGFRSGRRGLLGDGKTAWILVGPKLDRAARTKARNMAERYAEQPQGMVHWASSQGYASLYVTNSVYGTTAVPDWPASSAKGE